MMDSITLLLENTDLGYIHALCSITGIILSVLSMSGINPKFQIKKHYSYRVGYALIGLALAWNINYAIDKSWQPWPPNLALIIAVDYFLAVRLWGRSLVLKVKSKPARPSGKSSKIMATAQKQ